MDFAQGFEKLFLATSYIPGSVVKFGFIDIHVFGIFNFDF